MLGSVAVLLVILLVCYVMAKAGIMLINAGIPKEGEYDAAAEERMVQYRTWIKGKDGGFTRGKCVEEEHSPMVIFDPGSCTEILGTICRLCTDSLPTPKKYSCKKCTFTAVDGYILEDLCDEHNEEKVLA